MGDEEKQREDPRLHVSAYTTNVRLGEREISASVHELGEGGARISTTLELSVGDVIQIAYPIPAVPDINWMPARVVRANLVDGRWHYGVEHQPGSDEARVAVRHLMFDLVLHPHFEDRRAGSRLAVRAPITVDSHPGTLEEVAVGGLLVITEARLERGQRATVAITFADGASETFPVEVVHAQLSRESTVPQYRAGVVFLRDDDGTSRIEVVLNRLLSPTWWRKRTRLATGGW